MTFCNWICSVLFPKPAFTQVFYVFKNVSVLFNSVVLMFSAVHMLVVHKMKEVLGRKRKRNVYASFMVIFKI